MMRYIVKVISILKRRKQEDYLNQSIYVEDVDGETFYEEASARNFLAILNTILTLIRAKICTAAVS